jgi:hypothetical protein
MARHSNRLACVLTVALLGAATARAQTPPDLQDLVGARGAGGETQMQARGYQLVRATRVRDQSWTFWWSDVQRACVAISTTEGSSHPGCELPARRCRRQHAAAAAPVRCDHLGLLRAGRTRGLHQPLGL